MRDIYCLALEIAKYLVLMGSKIVYLIRISFLDDSGEGSEKFFARPKHLFYRYCKKNKNETKIN